MHIELENLKTQETMTINPEGITFGRAGSNADVELRDQAVSKRHARIYEDAGTWYLEDLGSSNGTYVDRKKISGAIPLQEGMVFALSRFKFRVARIANGEGGGDEPLFEDDADVGPPAPTAAPPDAETSMSLPSGSAPPMSSRSQGPQSDLGPTAPPASAPPRATPAPADYGDEPGGVPPPEGGDDVQSITPAYFMVAVPKAVGQFLIWVPALALAPWSVIPKGIKEQKHHAMGKLELMAYSMPATFISAVLGTFAGAIATLIAGGGFGAAVSGMIGGLVAAVVSAIIVGFITGFFGHQILAWLVNLLKGESDARSRTNFFLQMFTATILIAVPNALGTILGTIPFAQILAPVLLTAGSLISAFLFFNWFKYFRVHHVVPKVFLVIGALAALGGLFGVVTNTIASVKWALDDSPSSSPGGDIAIPSGGEDDAEEAAEKAKELAEKAKEAAEEVAEKAKDDAEKAKDDAEEVAEKGKKDKGKKDKGKKDKGKKDKDDEKLATTSAPDVSDEPSDEGAGPPEVEFGKYADLVENVDEIIKEDPLVLEKAGAKDLYRKISAARYEARRRFEKKMATSPQHELVHEAEREAEVYKRTANWVKQLDDLID